MTIPLTYAACAATYALLAAIILVQATRSRTAWLLACASAATAGWATVTAIGAPPSLASAFDVARAASWYVVTLHLYRHTVRDRQRSRSFAVVGAAGVSVAAACVVVRSTQLGVGVPGLGLPLSMLLAVGQLVLTENLFRGSEPDKRWHVGLACVALGALAFYDLVLSADAVLSHRFAPGLVAGRAAAAIVVAPLLAVASARNRDWQVTLHASRTAAFHSAVLMGSGVFLISLAGLAAFVGHSTSAPGSDWSSLLEVCLVFSGAVAVAVLLVSASTRHWLARLVAEHFFTYRYDYRREWLSCIATLSAPDHGDPDGLRRRAIRALADVVDSPAGLLLEGEPGRAGLVWSGSWNLPAIGPLAAGHELLDRLARDGCVEMSGPLDGLRLWLAVALPGPGQGPAAGCVLLAPPRGPFRLDDEVRALLGVVAREVATRLAEQRATRALLETRDLRAYGERFAFVAHDIKNVAGQLRLLTANARSHMGNPEFQADMLATIEASVHKIGRLIRRLEIVEGVENARAASELGACVDAVLNARRTGPGSTPAISLGVTGPHAGGLPVAIPQPDLEAALTHLIDNAANAAGPAGSVRLAITDEGGRVALDIADDGPGMTAEFIRDELFRPFRSRTEGGSGIGAFQARELLRRCGGDLLVHSRQGVGTTVRLLLPRAEPVEKIALSA